MTKTTHFSLKNCMICFFASAFQAAGMYNIHALSGVTEGGVFGLILLLDHWLNLSPAISNVLFTGGCFLLGWRTLGKEFIGYSLVATAGYSLTYAVCEQFPPLWPGIAELPLLASVLGGLVIGIGAGLCVRAGGATGGDDALVMSLNHLTRIPMERLYFVSDLVVLVLSLSYIPLKRIAYSLLTVTISGQLIGFLQKKPDAESANGEIPAANTNTETA